jgi:iron complex transport system substrate-binding protein
MSGFRIPIAAAALAICANANAAPANPQHVMSLNLCADQLVLSLLPRMRIASVSFLSRKSEHALLTAEDAHVPVNFGSSEEVLAQHPDLVIVGSASTPATRDLLKRANIPLLEVPFADDFAAIRSTTRMVARALGEEAKAEALIGRMDATLAELAATAPARRITVAAWDASGDVPGTNTLFNVILTAAGAVNVAATMNVRFGSFDMEQLIAAKPDILAYGDSLASSPGLRREALHHPLIQKLYANRQIAYPETPYNCGLPQSAESAKSLRAAMLKAMGSGSPR